MDVIFNKPILENPIIKLNKNIDNEALDQIHIFVLFDFFLNQPELFNGKGIRLTSNGWLNLNFCKQLYDRTPLSNEMIDLGISKKIDERTNKFIGALHDIMMTGGLVRKYKGFLVIT